MFSDLKSTLRSLLKMPGFTVIVVLTLALGIGAATAIFSVLNTVLLKPLPYAQPERLARIYTEFPTYPGGGMERFVASTAEYVELRHKITAWQSIDAWVSRGANMATAAEPDRITASYVTGGLLSSLGIQPLLGRLITARDDRHGAELVAVLSYGLWQRAFSGDRGVVGRDISLDGRKHVVIGVMPKHFDFPIGEADISDVWAPMQLAPENITNDSHSVWLLGRLKPGFTLQQARAELNAVVQRQDTGLQGHRFDPKEHILTTYGLHDEVVFKVRPALRMVFGAVCFLLLIACMNVANLMLVRAEARQREIAVRSALGAGLWRLAGQFIGEGLVLSLFGALLGLLLAYGGLQLLLFIGADGIPRVTDINIDGRVLSFAVGVSLLTGAVFGLAPFFHVVTRNLHSTMKSAGASTTDTAGAQCYRHTLVVTQLALALVLLIGTGLMLRASWKLQQVEGGFDPKSVTTMSVALPYTQYSGQGVLNFWTTLQTRLAALPGVTGAALATALPPVVDTGVGYSIGIEGFTPTLGSGFPTASNGQGAMPLVDRFQVISPGYFDTLKIRLTAGRDFDARDDAKSPAVAIINQSMARAIWGNESPLGRRIRPGMTGGGWATIVGVIADVKNNGMNKPTGTEVYAPYTQMNTNPYFLLGVRIAVRSPSATSAIVNAARRIVQEIDPALPVTKIRTLGEVISDTQSGPRFLTVLLSVFAGVALILAAVGIYGVISYAVAQRTKEFGLRMALGAQPEAVLGLVLKRGALLTACGVGIGIAGAFGLTRFLSGFLFGITATDAATFVAVALVLSAIAVLACYLPARRATKVDPSVALRAE
jgi:putative ABC transport system permease protein